MTNQFFRRLFLSLFILSAFSVSVYAAPSSEANWRSSTPQENKTVLEYWTIIAFNEEPFAETLER